jgi:hypothetical protein
MTAEADGLAGSRAVLIGVSDYDHREFPPIRAARNSLQAMRALLADPALCGWPPGQITVIENPASAASLADQVADLAESTTGILLLYYVGHGTLSPRGELCLTVTSTRPSRPKYSGLPWENVAEILRACPARARLVILDCCFAGQAIEALSGDGDPGLADIAHVEGVYTLTATTRNRTAHVPPPDQQGTACTSFTGELIDLIQSGIPGKPPRLTFGDIYPVLRQRLLARGLPAPSQRGTDTAHQFPFTANAICRLGPDDRPNEDGAGETARKDPDPGLTDRTRARRVLNDALRVAQPITEAANIDDLVWYGGSNVARRLRSHAEAAREIDRHRRPAPIDRLLLAPRGQEVIARFFTTGDADGPGDLDVAVAWAVILDELVQKTAATGRRVEQVVTEDPIPRPWERRSRRELRRRSPGQVRQVIRISSVPSRSFCFSTAYMDKLGFAEWPDGRIDSDILGLDAARIEIERSLGFPAPEEWIIPDSIPYAALRKASGYTIGFRLYKQVAEALERISAREHNGQTFVELQHNDPVTAPYVLHQAIHEGLLCFDLELGRSLLISERPEVDNVSIDAHIANAEQMAASAREALTKGQSARKETASEQAAQDWQDRAAALRRWRSVGQRSYYEQLMKLCFSQDYRSSINRPLIGVLRELIFMATAEGKVWWTDRANKDLALRMLPDEAIASAIMEACRSDAVQSDALMGAEKVLRRVVPALKETTHFQVGDTLQTLIRTGLVEGAADGKPYLTGREWPWSVSLGEIRGGDACSAYIFHSGRPNQPGSKCDGWRAATSARYPHELAIQKPTPS